MAFAYSLIVVTPFVLSWVPVRFCFLAVPEIHDNYAGLQVRSFGNGKTH